MGRGRFGATCSSDWCALQEALYKCIYTIHEFVITVFGFCVSRMQSYGTTPGPGEEHSSIPSAPPSSEGLGFPGGAHGNQYPPPGSGYAPAGQGYPPAEKGYPPAGPGYPPAGPGYPPAGPGYPPAGQGYPPAGAGYPPAGQGYPPGGPGYPPTGQGYQQGGQSGFPSGGQSYPPGQPSSAGKNLWTVLYCIYPIIWRFLQHEPFRSVSGYRD